MIVRFASFAVFLVAACVTPALPLMNAVGPAIVRNSPEAGPDVQAAAYVRIYNPSSEADRLIGVTCACADAVEIHNTHDRAMHSISSIDVPAQGYLEIAPGGPNHLMLMGVREVIEPGQTIHMTLIFERSQPLEIDFTAVENSREGWAERNANH